MAIAVAPGTHWKYYDNIYTERYNGLPQDNRTAIAVAFGLREADDRAAAVVHGTGDDNVLQNTGRSSMRWSPPTSSSR
jgi:dipeptidyl-peptidase-4